MSAQFVQRVLSYCLGVGSIGLKGSRKRPWLEIVRPETEKVYQNLQLRQLKEIHPGPLEYFWDVVPTDGFYDKNRLRVRSDELYRAYELMYPRDKKVITPEILSICGLYGVAALWIDRGRVVGRQAKLHTRFNNKENQALQKWLSQNGFNCFRLERDGSTCGVRFDRPGTEHFVHTIRPHVHRSMRHTLRAAPTRK